MSDEVSNASAAAVVDLQAGKRRNRWDDVVRAAVEVFWQEGYSASRVQEVADSVGMLKGSLYHYIRTKEDLLLHVVEDVHHGSREILGAVQELDVTPLERLGIYIERHVTWFLTNYKEVSVYFSEWRYLTDERHERAIAYRRSYDAIIRRMIADAQAAGEIHPALDPKYAAFFVHSAINGVSEWYDPAGPDPAEAVARTYAAMAVAMLRAWQPGGPVGLPVTVSPPAPSAATPEPGRPSSSTKPAATVSYTW